MKTIIAEKPSVAREIARIVGATKREEGYFEGGGYAVTWAFGHLVQLAMPDGYGVRGFVRDNLPIIPDSFTLIPRQVKTEKGYKPDSGVVSQIKIIATLFNKSEQIIVATDAGREGELIFRYLYHYTGCTTPFVRLWISSLTDKAIREGLRNLENGGKYDNLYLAAKARSESDWLVGINGTQALSIAAGHGTYSVGRVQTPTLGMVCERYRENRRFTPEAFWQLHIAVDGNNNGTVKFSSSEKWKEKEPATALYNKVKEAASRHRRDESAGPEPSCRYRRAQRAEQADALHGQRAETPGQHPQCGPGSPHGKAVLRKAQRQPQPERHQRTVQHGPASGQPQQERAPLPQGGPHCRPRPERTVHPLFPVCELYRPKRYLHEKIPAFRRGSFAISRCAVLFPAPSAYTVAQGARGFWRGDGMG